MQSEHFLHSVLFCLQLYHLVCQQLSQVLQLFLRLFQVLVTSTHYSSLRLTHFLQLYHLLLYRHTHLSQFFHFLIILSLTVRSPPVKILPCQSCLHIQNLSYYLLVLTFHSHQSLLYCHVQVLIVARFWQSCLQH